jgi:hypothetical protein
MLCRKSAMVLLLAVMALGAFATLGDGKAKNTNPGKKSLLSTKSTLAPGSFSLRSGYSFRGRQVINMQVSRYINLNTTVTYQNGHTSYIVPLKKKLALKGKIVFNPNEATRR